MVSFDPAAGDELAALAAEHGVPFHRLGEVVPDDLRVLDLVAVPVAAMRRAWCPVPTAGSRAPGISELGWRADEETTA